MIDCRAGERKHGLAEEHSTKTKITQGLFLILVTAQAPSPTMRDTHYAAIRVAMQGVFKQLGLAA